LIARLAFGNQMEDISFTLARGNDAHFRADSRGTITVVNVQQNIISWKPYPFKSVHYMASM
jgi:hypothetical protein